MKYIKHLSECFNIDLSLFKIMAKSLFMKIKYIYIYFYLSKNAIKNKRLHFYNYTW